MRIRAFRWEVTVVVQLDTGFIGWRRTSKSAKRERQELEEEIRSRRLRRVEACFEYAERNGLPWPKIESYAPKNPNWFNN